MMCILLSWLQHNMEMLVTKITPQHKMRGVFPVSKWEREHILVHTSAISVLKVYGH